MPLTIPRDPLARLLAIGGALAAERWWNDAAIMRYAALPLILSAGSPAEVAARVVAASRDLAGNPRWFAELAGPIRHVVAALAASGREPEAFTGAVGGLRTRLRSSGIRRGPGELVAAAMLHIGDAASDGDLRRVADLLGRMAQPRQRRPADADLPGAALLAVHAGEPAAAVARSNDIHAGLAAAGLRADHGLRLLAHVLALGDGSEGTMAERFAALHRGCLARGIQPTGAERDDLALLGLAQEEPARSIARIVEHRHRLRAQLPFAGSTPGVGCAFATAMLGAHAGAALDPRRARLLAVVNLALAANAALAPPRAAPETAAAGSADSGAAVASGPP